ncbi:MAG: CRISPR-associated helicase Cas3' [Pseudomonadota bacterium]
MPLAHVRQDPDGQWREHALEEHLRGAAARSAESATHFGGEDWAYLAALWHDLGKYSEEFQTYIKNASGYERSEAHIETSKGKVDHSTAGAIYAVEQFKEHGRVLAYLISGHHAGLPDWYPDEAAGGALSVRLQQQKLLKRTLCQNIPPAILQRSKPSSPVPGGKEGFALWLRMLFSCLVDADFLDTEAFMDGKKAGQRGGYPLLSDLLPIFDAYMQQKTATAQPSKVNRIRADVLRQCREKAVLPPGLFSLTVPTGGGKTLSSLAFALRHAQLHSKRRIIYAIPYTSIIEQTANIFREIFGGAVVEHHSNLDPDSETAKSRLASENWDAPIIVTTNVQLFESLFAARTSRVRKLHNLANSVVVLDEAQLLPPEFLRPILKAVRLLAAHYGVSFVLSTATQPALNSREGLGWRFEGLDNVREIMDDPDGLYSALKRVDVQLPEDLLRPKGWEEVASELRQHESALCIVNRREDCRELFRMMPPGTVHLSALMCGEHRSRVIAEIKQRLANGEPVHVISTQLVEAGVDLDFPVVYRALAGLDSIAQAAGRCNREGKLECGRVVVFVPPKSAPSGLLRKGEQTAVGLLSGFRGDPLTRDWFQRYFEHFYRKTDLDRHGIEDLLKPDRLEVQFRTAAIKFRLIDSAYQPVFVQYGESPSLLGRLEKEGPERWLMRKLQRYTVNLPERQFKQMLAQGDLREVHPGMFALVSEALYDAQLGVIAEDAALAPDSLVI